MPTYDDKPDKDRDIEVAVDYESLKFIELQGTDSKRPAKKWGGYDQDFDEAQHVLDHESVASHPSDDWAVVDVEDIDHGSVSLLIVDFDTYKLPDEFDTGRVEVPDDTLVTKSQRGGNHYYFKIHAPRGSWSESDFDVHEELPIDIRGSAVSAHVVAPSDFPGVDGSYDIVNDEPIKTFFEPVKACEGFTIDGEPGIEFGNRTYDGADSPPGTDVPDDEWLLPGDVKDALTHISPDVEYPMWRDIGFAIAEYYTRVADEDAFDAALDEFVEWSENGVKWDDEAERQAYTIIKNAFNKDPDKLRNGPVTVGTLINTAAQNGWEVPDRDERVAYRFAREVVDEWPTYQDIEDGVGEKPSDDDVAAVARSVTNLNDDHFNELADALVERIPDVSERRFHEHRQLSQLVDELSREAFHHDGKLVAATKPGPSPWYKKTELLNFEMHVESVLDIDDERMAQLDVITSEPTEDDFELEIEPRTFNDARRFEDTVLAKRFSTVIEAPMSDSVVMDYIRQYIASLDVPTRTGQYEMGLSDDGSEFVTPVGTITPGGWTDDPNHVYVQRANQKNATVRAFSADPDENTELDEDSVARMIELAAQSREPERIAGILGWFYATPYRPRITSLTGQFNPLNVTGRSGSGKTATLAALNQMWGMDTEPQSAEASKHAMLTGFASSRGIPVWFDEYRPENIPDYVVDRFHAFYKKAATGGVEPRGNQSMGTDDWHLRSPVVVSGESEIRDNAERRRTVNVTVTQKPTQDGHPGKTAFKELVGDVTVDDDGVVSFPNTEYDLQDHAVAYYSHITEMSEDKFRESWFGARETVAELVDQWGDDIELDDTEIQALQTVVFGYRQMITFAQTIGADLSMLPSTDDLERALELIADVDGDGRQPHEHQFMSLVSRAAAAGYLDEEADYKVVHEGKPKEQLRISVTQVFDKVSKYARDHDLNTDLLQSSTDYKHRFRQLETENTFVRVTSQNTPPIGRCTGVDMDAANESIAGFERSVFVDDGSDEEASNDNNGGDGSGPTPVNALDAKDGDYVHVTVEIVDWGLTPDEVLDSGGPMLAGSVADTEGRVDIVAFEEPGVELSEGECYRIRKCKTVKYEGSIQLVLDHGVSVQRIQPGAGLSPGVESSESQAELDGDEAVNAVVDGGGTPQEDRVKTVKAVIGDLDADAGAPIEDVLDVVESRGIDRDTVEGTIEKLRQEGQVYAPQDDHLRPVWDEE